MLKEYGDKNADAVVMDGLLAPNAPLPKPPSPAAGIAEIMFDIGGILGADPAQRAYRPRADLRASSPSS